MYVFTKDIKLHIFVIFDLSVTFYWIVSDPFNSLVRLYDVSYKNHLFHDGLLKQLCKDM
jgi:hypothetical protein